MRKYLSTILLLFFMSSVSAQIKVDQFDLTIESELSDTLQGIYQKFLNEEVEKISIATLKKKYSRLDHYQFMKNKKWYQSEKKWIEENSYEGESIVIAGEPYPFVHFDSMVFEYRYGGIETEFIAKEIILDSTELRLALTEMFNGAENTYIDLCYAPRHAVLFYNPQGEISGIYEICFRCDNVLFGITGVDMVSKSSPYIQSLFTKYKDNLE